MNVLKALLVLMCYVYQTRCESDVCYGDLGCFTNGPPFGSTVARPIGWLPESPEKINTRFFLYTRNNPKNPISISHNQTEDLNGLLETKIIVHGFVHNSNKKWIIDMKDELLKLDDFNVIVVDWSKGSGLPFTQATANTQIVGAEIARLVNSLARNNGLKTENVHIIGHSLGAHIGGYAGDRMWFYRGGRLGRITGLDPAGPYFEYTAPKVRLDVTDALFVDVIHTDGAPTYYIGLGLLQSSGHVDFYPNGGLDQPKCVSTLSKVTNGIFNLAFSDYDEFEKVSGCSHFLAVYIFTDSILNKDCKYVSYRCHNQEDFNSGKCLKCGLFGCNRMGYWASPKHDIGSLYLKTQDADNYPFCQHHYLLTVNSNSLPKQVQTYGKFSIELEGEYGKSSTIQYETDKTIKANSTSTYLLEVTKHLGDTIKSATIKFTKTTSLLSSWLYENQWSFKNIEITYGDSQYSAKLCPESEYILSGNSLRFAPC